MNPSKSLGKLVLVFALGALVASPGPLHAAATDIADAPLAQPAGSVKPNMLLILDDSGSMGRQFTPDYVTTNSQAGTIRGNCFDSRDFNNPPTATNLQDCFAGDPPGMTADFNTQYYDPEIRYFPAVNFDGTSRGDMNCTRTGGTLSGGVCTGGWTAAPTDNVSVAGSNVARKGLHLPLNDVPNPDDGDLQWGRGVPGTPLMTMNLVTGFPDRVWCNAANANVNDPAVCKTNSAYTYPDNVFGFGRDSGNRKYRLGPPYYYRINTTEFCNNAGLVTVAGEATPGCIAATAPSGTYTFPAKVRFCNSAAHTTCQGKRTAAFRFPKYLGKLNTSATTPGTRAQGKITLATGDAGAPTISQITITLTDLTTVNLLGAALTTAPTDTPGNRLLARTSIINAINANFGLHGYTALNGTHSTAANGTTEILIDAPTILPADNISNNGSSINVTAPAGTTIPARLQFLIGSAGALDQLTALRIGPPGGPAEDLVSAAVGCPPLPCNNNTMAGAIAAAINAASPTHGYSATVSAATVTVIAPAGTGSERNGWPMVFSTGGLTVPPATVLANGVTPGDLTHSTTNFSGGIDANPYRVGVGNFVRTTIVPGRTYTKFPGRSDCAGASTCTYEEEMTNFANWFAYYRTRMQMAKTAIGRAFLTLTDDFRVGFMTINFSTTHYLAVNDFNPGAGQQKNTWYTRLYNAGASGSTPLREALARAGRYYGNQNPDSMGTGVIQKACQPNYTILTSDGYWNDSSNPKQLNGSTNIGNQDGSDSGYSTKAVGAWDKLNASNTLADVAMYYYKTDLRPDLSDLMPTTQQAPDIAAPHQHMVTFTVGMGLAGTLNYDPNYQTAQTGDFVAIKQGTTPWPAPAANAETTLDDMWHAAVNGRGRFFSAQDPVALSNGIADTLNQVAAKLGAGAAAATSNLQPVAGDNFAFTAQYKTVEWSGDLRARTIDLSTGIVASRELWSAQASLDLRPQATRRIYVFDANDKPVAEGGTPDNNNKLKVFCWPGAGYTGCAGEPELTTTELDDHFNPLGGPNGGLFQSIPWPTDGSNRHLAATRNNLVDFIRGDTVNESTGGFAATDLYRNREHLLGDIVNAQPAYVKAPPFNYQDPFYIEYKNAKTPRKGTVFAAANDGMLHAFETDPDNKPYFQTGGIGTPAVLDDTFSDTSSPPGTLNTSPVSGEGAERWAYIPTMVLPTLKRLAETNYATNHRFSVDGSPAVGDVCFDHTLSTPCSAEGNWRTILVAGLNAGGRGYYALDVTNPDSPNAMWELKGGTGAACLTDAQANSGNFDADCNIGLTFGNPVIVKRPTDGKWVVIVSSGHNNINPGDGKGYLYLIDVKTGKILQRIGTGVGCDGVSVTAPCTAGTADPSGLARINAWVDNATANNTARTVYAGDLKGNVWRFQLEFVENNPAITTDNIAAGSVTLLAQLVDGSGNPQPVTTKVELGEVQGSSGNKYRFVFVATGQFLGETDKADTQRQSVYAIKDGLLSVSPSAPIHVNMRSSGDFIQQTITATGGTRTVTNNTVDVDAKSGWFVDLPDGGTGTPTSPTERVNVDPVLQLGTLVVPSNVPSSGDDCVAGGTGWINFFNYKSGSYVDGATDNMLSVQIPSSLVVGINVIQLPGGDVKTIVTTADNQQLTQNTPVSSTGVQGRRVSWRELLVQ